MEIGAVSPHKLTISHPPPSYILKHVDLDNSFLCGYLHIKGLTEDWPTLCTFFEAEVIGPKHSFLTRKWDADERIDRDHWMRFPAFKKYEKCFNSDGFEYDFDKNDYIFMRWKVRIF